MWIHFLDGSGNDRVWFVHRSETLEMHAFAALQLCPLAHFAHHVLSQLLMSAEVSHNPNTPQCLSGSLHAAGLSQSLQSNHSRSGTGPGPSRSDCLSPVIPSPCASAVFTPAQTIHIREENAVEFSVARPNTARLDIPLSVFFRD